MQATAKLKTLICLGVTLLSLQWAQAQFNVRWNNGGADVKGDFTMIGNNSMTKRGYGNRAYSDKGSNGGGDMEFVDIDGDNSTFQSSSATLKISSDSPQCLKVKWAGLYWGSYYRNSSAMTQGDSDQVKLKLPGGNAYHQITPTSQNLSNDRNYYIYLADVTALLQNSNTLNGEYTVADIAGTPVRSTSTSGGWTLVVVYENNNDERLPSRKITLYDGFSSINGTRTLDIPISGFQSIPFGQVNFRLGTATLEGDVGIPGDYFEIKGRQKTNYTLMGNSGYPNDRNNFFDSTISEDGAFNFDRNPLSRNTVGWDVKNINVDNPNNDVIGNNETTVDVRFGTRGDFYMTFFLGFSVETIAPNLEIEKNLQGKDRSGKWVDFTDQPVGFGTELIYSLKFKNTGNEDAVDAVLEDLLPANVTFDDLENLPAGITLLNRETVNVNGVQREKISLKISDELLKKGGGLVKPINIHVRVVENCKAIRDACSNQISNEALIRYKSALDKRNNLNPLPEYQKGSFNGKGECSKEPSPTNFLVVDPSCDQAQDIWLCGTETQLTAGNGFDSYTWTKTGDASFSKTGQTITVIGEGVYTVAKVKNGACPNGVSIVNNSETFNVRYYNPNRTENPIKKYATKVDICGDDGKEYVQIFLCGDESKTLSLPQYATAGVKWYKYTGTTTNPIETCPILKNSANASQWQTLNPAVSHEYTVTEQGSYAVEITFIESGGIECSQLYYFRAFKSNYNYTVSQRHLMCNANGSITIDAPGGTSVATNQYKVVKNTSPVTIIQDWTDMPASGTATVSITPTNGEGAYTTYVRQKLADPALQDNVCQYPKSVNIRRIDVDNTLTVTAQDVHCYNGNDGVLRITLPSDVYQPYTITVRGTALSTPIVYKNLADSNNADVAIKGALTSLKSGTYTVTLTTDAANGSCNVVKNNIVINQPPALSFTATAAPIECKGKKVINVVVKGGTPAPGNNYSWGVTNAGVALPTSKITAILTNSTTVTESGITYAKNSYNLELDDTWSNTENSRTYQVTVTDNNGCSASPQTVTIKKEEKPKFTLNPTPADCNLTAGTVTFNITNANFNASREYIVEYELYKKEIDNVTGKESWTLFGNRQTNPNFTGLTKGDYKGYVYYRKGATSNECRYPEPLLPIPDDAGGTTIPTPSPDQIDITTTVTDGGGPIVAFAGVSQLACKGGKAKVRVVNVSGGVPPYEFMIDNVNTWQSIANNEVEVDPNKEYTIRVRGTNPNCEKVLRIQVPDVLQEPTFATPTITYDCEGKGEVTLNPENNVDYLFAYEAPGATRTSWGQDATVTISPKLSAGNHTIKVYYKHKKSPTPSLLIQEDFGEGETTANSNVPSVYRYESQIRGVITGGDDINNEINDGEYTVTRRIQAPFGSWISPLDHTSGGTNPYGRYLAINIGGVAGVGGVIYKKTVYDVIPNQPIKFELFALNLLKRGARGGDPNIEIRLVSPSGDVIDSYQSGFIPKNTGNQDWIKITSDNTKTLNPGTHTTLDVEIRTNSTVTDGNDLAVDDIKVYQEPKACTTAFLPIPITIEAGKSFDFQSDGVATNVLCNGDTTGQYSINVNNVDVIGGKFEYRLLKSGVPFRPASASQYLEYVATTTASVANLSLTGLPAGDYTLEIRPKVTPPATQNTACLKTKNFTITQPTELVVNPTALGTQEYLGCNETSKYIRIEDYIAVSGGTPPYKYVVSGGGASGLVSPTVATTTPTGNYVTLPASGTYTIEISYGSNCNTTTSKKRVTFTLSQRVEPTLSLSVSCPDVNTGLSTLTATSTDTNTGAVLTYYIKEQTATDYSVGQSSNVFANLTAGNYTVKVKNQYGCEKEQSIEVSSLIRIDGVPVVHFARNCASATGSTEGSITVNVTGGSASPTYQYAFVRSGATPQLSDYQSANFKNFSYSIKSAERYDVWAKDTQRNDCPVKIATGVEMKYEQEPTFSLTPKNPDCAAGNGNLAVAITQVAAPYSLKVVDASNNEVYFAEGITTVPNTVKISLPADTYTVTLTDRYGCAVTHAKTLTDPVLEGTIQDLRKPTAPACNPPALDLGFGIVPDRGNTAGYTILYSKDNGTTWQTSPEFYGIAPGTPVQPVMGRFPIGTSVSPTGTVTATELCRKDFGTYVTKVDGGIEVDYNSVTPTPATGGCVSSYSVDVRMGGTATYAVVEYAQDVTDPEHAGAGTVWHPATVMTSPYKYTFNNLIPGRDYTFAVRYKAAGSSTYCYGTTTVNLADTHIPTPSIKPVAKVIPPCFGETVGKIEFTLTGGDTSTTFIDWDLMQVDLSTGVESSVTGVTSTSSKNNLPYTSGMTITVSNIPQTTGGSKVRYYIKVTEVGGSCASANTLVDMPATTANAAVSASARATDLGCSSNTDITITASGGVGGYVYKLNHLSTNNSGKLRRSIQSTSNVISLSKAEFLPTVFTSSPTSITLEVQVEDRDGCSITTNAVINVAPAPTFTVAATNNCGLPYSVTITPASPTTNIGDYRYSVDGGITYHDSNVQTVPVNFDEKQVRVQSKSTGCVSEPLAPKVIIFPDFVATAVVKTPAACPAGTGVVTIKAMSGSGNYSYTITATNPANSKSSTSFTKVAGATNGFAETDVTLAENDTYTIEIEDTDRAAGTCKTKTVTVSLDKTDTPAPNVTTKDISCNTGADGQMIVRLDKATHKQGPYTYQLMLGGILITQTGTISSATEEGRTYSSLNAGTYTLTITSARGCVFTDNNIVIKAPAQLTAEVDTNPTTGTEAFGCASRAGAGKAEFVLKAQGGTPPYTFIINGSRTSLPGTPATAATPASGTHTYVVVDTGVDQNITWSVEDANGCVATVSSGTSTYTMKTQPKFNAVLSTQKTMTCTAAEEVSVNITRTVTSTAGFEITVKDATGAVVSGLSGIRVPLSGTSATATITMPAPSTNPQGGYTFVVKDMETKCEESYPYVLNPVVMPTISATADKACFGERGVNMHFNISGNLGTTGYIYKVKRKDSGTEVYSGAGTVAEVQHQTVTIPTTIAQVAGTYLVELTVTETGCVVSAEFDVVQPSGAITVSLQKLRDVSVNCDGTSANDGIIALTAAVKGGWGVPYSYRLLSSGNPHSSAYGVWSSSVRYEGLEPGTYTVEVRDSNGCTVSSSSIALELPTKITTSGTAPTATAVTCYGDADGSLTITNVTGGTTSNKDYEYTLRDKVTKQILKIEKGTIDPVTKTGIKTFHGLPAGEYQVVITHPLFQCDEEVIDVTVPAKDVVSPTISIATFPDCNTNGEISFSVVGGNPTGGYTYQRVDVATKAPMGTATSTATNYPIDYSKADKYQFLVTDSKGCQGYTNVIEVDKVEPITVTDVPAQGKYHLNCDGDTSGKIVAVATGGSVDGSFRYELLDATGNAVAGQTPNMTGEFWGLPKGSYIVQATKVVGATVKACAPGRTSVIEITSEAPFTAQGVKTDVVCNGENNGEFTITMGGTLALADGTPREFQYAISPRLDRFFDNGGVFQNLEPGDYTIIVQDQNGCRPTIVDASGNPTGEDVFTFTITEPTLLSANVTPGTVIHEGCLGASDAELKLSIVGGTPFVDTTVSPAEEYYQVSPLNDELGTYTRYNPATGLIGLPAGSGHMVWVKDKNGCKTLVVLPEIEPGVDLGASAIVEYTCNGTNTMGNRVTVTMDNFAMNGVVKFYSDSNATPTNNPVFTFPAVPIGSPAETHTIRIEKQMLNHKMCSNTITVTIQPQEALSWGIPSVTHVSCNGLNDGEIIANVSGGSGNYRYAISPDLGVFDTSNVFQNLESGFYTIIVQDVDYDCQITQRVQVKEPDALEVVGFTTQGISCYKETDGEAQFSIKGGMQPYTYNVYFKKDTVRTTAVANGVSVTPLSNQMLSRLAPDTYVLVVTDTNGCSLEREFVIEDSPNTDPQKIEVFYNCEGAGIAPTYDVYVTFDNPYFNLSNIKYTIDGETATQARAFTRFDSQNVAVIENASLADGSHTITLYYERCVKQATPTFEVTNYGALNIVNTTLTDEINAIRVKVQGGKAPYKVYFTSPNYTDVEDIKAFYNQVQDYTATTQEISYYVQRTDFGDKDANGIVTKTVRIYVEDDLGCGYYVDIYKEFVDIQIPNYFTPNGDGHNDLWYPHFMDNYPNAEVRIFDRYGRFVAKLKTGQGWNGMYNNKELPTGDYWYILKLNEPDDDRVFKGHFNLYR